MNKVAIIGSRSFNNYEMMEEALDKLHIDLIISGGARGADKLAERYARKHKINIQVCVANWNKYGRSAGMKRNMDMLELCDEVIAFWNGKSVGTKHMIENGRKQGKKVEIIPF